MRQEYRYHRIADHIRGWAAEQIMRKLAVFIGPHDDELGADFLCRVQNGLPDGMLFGFDQQFGIYAMPLEVANKPVRTFGRGLADTKHGDLGFFFENGHGIAEGASS